MAKPCFLSPFRGKKPQNGLWKTLRCFYWRWKSSPTLFNRRKFRSDYSPASWAQKLCNLCTQTQQWTSLYQTLIHLDEKTRGKITEPLCLTPLKMLAYTSSWKECSWSQSVMCSTWSPSQQQTLLCCTLSTEQVTQLLPPLTPILKALLSTAAPMEWEAAHTTKVIYACYIGRNTTFSGSCSAQFAIIFLILLISLFYNTFLTILTYIRIWLAVFIVTFKFTHSSNDFQLFGVRWIIRFRVLKKKKNP